MASSRLDEIEITKEQMFLLREAIDAVKENIDPDMTDAEAIEFMAFDVVWSFA